ncbi:SRPBCC family protein [Undibacterium sp. TJN25]|uniref:SRPBCC family protein n=1 Tax=Undibacterium sp. TJN25 TaxID=3413056 RepID=UPI003BF26716
MATAETKIELAADADQVWALIGGFGSLPDWLPYIPTSELAEGGRLRSLATPDGQRIVERLLSFDHAARSYSYAILEAPFPVTDYRSTLRVKASGDGRGSVVEWSGEFTPNGVSDADASALFREIYEDGLKALQVGLAKK